MKIGKADFSIWGEEDVLIWQYCNAPNLAQIIENEFAFYKKNVNDFFNDWYNDVFNLLTANTFGLNVWANILGVKRPSVQAVNAGIDKMVYSVLKISTQGDGIQYGFREMFHNLI